MEDVVQLVGAAKGSSGLSFRDLASRADLAVSTVTRVTSGAIDPTFDTLTRLLDAAGYTLYAARRPREPLPTIGSLATAWRDRAGGVAPEWTRWRALLDQLALEPDRIPEAIYTPPPPAGSPIIDALLAAVAEKLADDTDLRRPAWTASVPSLAEPWQPPARGDQHNIPTQLAARGLIVDAASLWRDPATIGV